MDPNDLSNLDNNALFYGAPRTGKSVMAEKLAYEADIYPLVVIQGSTLTPNKANSRNNIDVALKFFFTICSITYDLVDDYGFERAGDGEARYILFLDEADQVCTTNLLPPSQVSTQLTFLKECMGNSINIAVYQAGRLSNPLSFKYEPEKDNDNQSSNQPPKKNPRNPKIEEVLATVEQTMKITANKISEDISCALGIACVIATGGAATPLVAAVAIGGGGVAGHLIGNKVEQEEKKVKNQEQELELRSQTIETLKKDNEKLQADRGEKQNEYKKQEQENQQKEKGLEDAKDKSQKLLDEIRNLEEKIKNNNKNITSVGSSGSSNKGTIMEFFTPQNILIVFAVYALWQIEKEKKEKQQACLRAFNHYFPSFDREIEINKERENALQETKPAQKPENKPQPAQQKPKPNTHHPESQQQTTQEEPNAILSDTENYALNAKIKNNPQNNPQWQADLVARKKRLAKLERQTQSNPSRLDSNHNSNQINTKPNNSHLGLYLLGDTTLLGSHPLGSFATPPLTIQKIDGGIFNTMYFNRFAENADNKHEPDAEAFFYFASKLNQPIQIPIRCTFLDEQNLIYWVLSDEVIEEIRTEKAK
ncbi:4383_t:CDS:10 [Entrophospora sp. SA101]|nr:4383_t:CDS:10 [Entrophospora sp. SA101]